MTDQEYRDISEHLEDPLTGELVEGTVEEETTSYLNLQEKVEESAEKLWMIPFADLMSTLVILFLALFGYAYLGANSNYERAVQELQNELATDKKMPEADRKKKEAELARVLEKKLVMPEMKEPPKVEITAQRIRISLPS